LLDQKVTKNQGSHKIQLKIIVPSSQRYELAPLGYSGGRSNSVALTHNLAQKAYAYTTNRSPTGGFFRRPFAGPRFSTLNFMRPIAIGPGRNEQERI
jgi:hypothetical protein